MMPLCDERFVRIIHGLYAAAHSGGIKCLNPELLHRHYGTVMGLWKEERKRAILGQPFIAKVTLIPKRKSRQDSSFRNYHLSGRHSHKDGIA